MSAMETTRKTNFKIATRESQVLSFFKYIRFKYRYDVIVFGFDVGWDVMYGDYSRARYGRYVHRRRRGGKLVVLPKTGKPVLEKMDICTGEDCVLLQFRYLKTIPDIVKTFLQAPDLIKVGYNISAQAKGLERLHDIKMATTVDVRHLVDEEGLNPKDPKRLPWILGEDVIPKEYLKTNGSAYPNQTLKLARGLKTATYARVFTSLTRKRARESLGLKDWQISKWCLTTGCALHFWRKYFDQPFVFEKSRFVRKQMIDLRLELGDTSCDYDFPVVDNVNVVDNVDAVDNVDNVDNVDLDVDVTSGPSDWTEDYDY